MSKRIILTICLFSTLLPYIVDALRANNPPLKHKQFEEISSYDSSGASTSNNDDEYQTFQSDISDEDLGYFYDFCLKLPELEKIGRIPKNRITQSTCKKLHIILDPLYRKTADTKTYKWF